MTPVLLTEKDVQAKYGLPLGTLRAWRWKGSPIPYIKCGRRIYYLDQDIQDFLDGCKRTSTSGGGRG